jgi:hypothetical protein
MDVAPHLYIATVAVYKYSYRSMSRPGVGHIASHALPKSVVDDPVSIAITGDRGTAAAHRPSPFASIVRSKA